jgi:hypothetical protein
MEVLISRVLVRDVLVWLRSRLISRVNWLSIARPIWVKRPINFGGRAGFAETGGVKILGDLEKLVLGNLKMSEKRLVPSEKVLPLRQFKLPPPGSLALRINPTSGLTFAIKVLKASFWLMGSITNASFGRCSLVQLS